MMRILDKLIEKNISILTDNDFQNFVEYLYILYYETDFTLVKSKRDKGSDGFLNSKKACIAIYGPEKRHLPQFQKKIRDDFIKYKTNWEHQYPNWHLVYNLSFTASEIEFVEGLKPNVEKVEPKHLLRIFQALIWVDKRNVADYLGIDGQFLQNDLLSTILDDLLLDDKQRDKGKPLVQPTYIEEKIELNFDVHDLESAKNEYYECLLYFETLRKLISSYPNNEQSALKSRILNDFRKFSGTFSQKLDNLTEYYSKKYEKDDLYVFNVRVVLLYFFEQCLIGKKTTAEKL